MMKLKEAKVGQVYNFEYEQPFSGKTTRYLAKVVGVRKLDQSEISRIDASSRYRMYDSDFARTSTLVTCQMPNGQFRTFYGERTKACRRLLFGGLMFALGIARFFAE